MEEEFLEDVENSLSAWHDHLGSQLSVPLCLGTMPEGTLCK